MVYVHKEPPTLTDNLHQFIFQYTFKICYSIYFYNLLFCLLSENIGESILYQWIEAAKDVLQGKSKHNNTENHLEDLKDIDDPNTSLNIKPADVPTITNGEIITDRKSVFQGHVATVTSVNQVK